MGDMRTKAQVAEVLSAYHPFWLRLGLEIVVGKPVPKQAAGSGRAELDAFAREHFLGDADLALQRAGNRAIKGLHSADYWVSHPCLAIVPIVMTDERRTHNYIMYIEPIHLRSNTKWA